MDGVSSGGIVARGDGAAWQVLKRCRPSVRRAAESAAADTRRGGWRSGGRGGRGGREEGGLRGCGVSPPCPHHSFKFPPPPPPLLPTLSSPCALKRTCISTCMRSIPGLPSFACLLTPCILPSATLSRSRRSHTTRRFAPAHRSYRSRTRPPLSRLRPAALTPTH